MTSLVAVTASRLGSVAEARLLIAHTLGVEPNRLLLAGPMDADANLRLQQAVARRLAGEPLQHITGVAPFRTVSVAVGPGVFIPRPETEVMAGWALDRLSELAGAGIDVPVVVELCAGSGAITKSLVAEAAGGTFHCVELSSDAWHYLTANLEGLGVDARLGDMADAFPELNGSVDLVIANPPYVPLRHWLDVPAQVRDYDPAMALVSGDDGLDAMRVVVDVASRLLRPGGFVCAEHAEVQSEAAPGLFVASGVFTHVRDQRDLTARPRFVTAVRAGRMVP